MGKNYENHGFPSFGLLGVLGGHFGRPWASRGPLRDRSWNLPGGPGRPLGSLLAALGLPTGRPLPILGRPGRLLGLSRAFLRGSGAALGWQGQLFTKHNKNHSFPWFVALRGPPGSPGGLPKHDLELQSTPYFLRVSCLSLINGASCGVLVFSGVLT